MLMFYLLQCTDLRNLVFKMSIKINYPRPSNSIPFQINIFFDFVDSKKIEILVLSESYPLEYGRINKIQNASW